jgi:hypothetical protein
MAPRKIEGLSCDHMTAVTEDLNRIKRDTNNAWIENTQKPKDFRAKGNDGYFKQRLTNTCLSSIQCSSKKQKIRPQDMYRVYTSQSIPFADVSGNEVFIISGIRCAHRTRIPWLPHNSRRTKNWRTIAFETALGTIPVVKQNSRSFGSEYQEAQFPDISEILFLCMKSD